MLYNKLKHNNSIKTFNSRNDEHWEAICELFAEEIYGKEGQEKLKKQIEDNKMNSINYLKKIAIKELKDLEKSRINRFLEKEYNLSLFQLFKKLKKDGIVFEEIKENKGIFNYILKPHWKIFCEGFSKID